MLKLRIFTFAAAALLLAAFLPALAGAQQAPLLEEGKKTIFQRVISHPGAALYAQPGGAAPSADIIPFTVLYVYERQNLNGQTWVKAAANTTGQDLAWVPADKTSEWKQSLVLLFAERAGREPLIFFNSADDLKNIASQSGIQAAMTALGREFRAYIKTGAPPPADMPVKAMEPSDEEGAVPYNHFYLMPIFSYEEPFEGVKLLEVGSIDPGTPEEKKAAPAGVKNAVAFVIDTTISMGPYIEESLDITRAIYDEVTRLGQGGNVALGMVAFRSSTEAVRGLEYTTRLISPLRTANDRAAFDEALRQVREARVSTHNFNEDSGAGLKAAIEELDWEPYVGRVIILITDAGPLEIIDPYQSTLMSNQAIADLARAKNIRIVTVHIKSPAGNKNHQYAQAAYQELSPPGGDLSTYLPLDAPTPEEGAANFGVTVKTLASSLSAALFGADAAAPDDGGDAGAMGRALGYSIRLDYLGQSHQSRAPSVIRSWIADRDLGRLDESLGAGRREVPTVQPAVLLSKDQLSFLSRQLEIIITEAERGMKSDTDIFRNILSASSQVAVDPDVYVKKPNANLVELGVLGEFLEGLPYKSDAMILTEGDWKAMNTGQQYQFVARLKSLAARYEEYDKDLDNWGKFGNPNPGDWLYRVPLNMLP